jgi:uncharacterized surface protein with fasciclin (FAS1) repeats
MKSTVSLWYLLGWTWMYSLPLILSQNHDDVRQTTAHHQWANNHDFDRIQRLSALPSTSPASPQGGNNPVQEAIARKGSDSSRKNSTKGQGTSVPTKFPTSMRARPNDANTSTAFQSIVAATLLSSSSISVTKLLPFLSNHADLSTLYDWTVQLDYNLRLPRQSPPLTLFLPTNAAFRNDTTATATTERMQIYTQEQYRNHLMAIIRHHMSNDCSCNVNDLSNQYSTLNTIQGEQLTIHVEKDGTVYIQSALVTNGKKSTRSRDPPAAIVHSQFLSTKDVQVHYIDQILWPDFVFCSGLDVLKQNKHPFSTFLILLVQSNLDTLISDSQNITILAPTDTALEALSKEILQQLESSQDLQTLLLQHILLDTVFDKDIGPIAQILMTAQGSNITATATSNDGIFFNGVKSPTSHLFDYGIIYALDAILPMDGNANASTTAPSTSSNTIDATTRKPFAPSSPSQRTQLPTTAPTRKTPQTMTKSATSRPVLLPTKPPSSAPTRKPTDTATKPNKTPSLATAQNMTVADYIASDPDLSSWNALIQDYPELVQLLSDETLTFTLFAPVNTALEGTRLNQYQSTPYSIHLADILSYHIVPGVTVTSQNFTNGLELTTGSAEDGTIILQVNKGQVQLLSDAATRSNSSASMGDDNPQVTTSDIVLRNGIVHKVDGVLWPEWSYLNAYSSMARYPDRFGNFIYFIQKLNKENAIKQLTNATVLGPTNAAFNNTVVSQSKGNKSEQAELLNHHLLPLVYNFEQDELPADTMETMAGDRVVTSRSNGTLAFNGVPAQGFVLYQSGIIYELESIMLL